MRHILKIALVALIGLSGCMNESDSVRAIEEMETELFNKEKNFDEAVAARLLSEYEDFAAKYKEHEMAPEFLDRGANIARQLKQFERGLANYQAIVNDHPDYDRIVETKFLIAFMYDNEIMDKAKAETHYKAVAEQYPDHVFGRNAKDRLVTLHMSDEELLEFFQQKNQ